jgi:1-acyl-sn-glycerol-3-phosphate acyltransferase
MLRRLAKFLLWLGGWTAVGKVPDLRKAVFIAAPHTSNWDGFWAIVYITYIGLDAHWFVKKSMFWFPLNKLLTYFGAVPLNRERGGSAVSEAVTAFDKNEKFYLGLAPEGTRSKMKGWKSGFYRIAEGANVPIVLGFLDFGSRRLGLGPVVTLTGDRDADMAILESFYSSVSGRWPDKTGPIRLAR